MPPILYIYIYIFDFVDIPDAHVWAGNDWETDGSGETLVTLGIIVLEADLELDGLEEVSLLGLERVLKKTLYVGTHSGCEAKKLVFVSIHSLNRNLIPVRLRKRTNIPTVILDMMTVFQ